MGAYFISKRRASARLFCGVIASILALWVLVGCQSPQPKIDFKAILISQDIDPSRAAIFVLKPDTGQIWSQGGARIDQRYIAASTSKIPHTFIALEDGYVTGADMFFKWDGRKRWSEGWNQDQTMAKAYARSAVWVFQDITQTLGPTKMKAGLEMLDYGNKDMGTPDDITTYWLDGPLKISAREQVKFLKDIYAEDFPLKANTYVTGKNIMAAGRDDGRFAKTGWYHSDEHQDIGWYVGWQEYEGRNGPETYIFAFNMDMDDHSKDPPKRARIVDVLLAAIVASDGG